ncbi:MAG: hypothetical protein P8Z30_16970 [Acidobacteriota bacterium]
MSESRSGVSWLHRSASLLAVMTFLVLMTGMLASGTGGAPFATHWAGLTGNRNPSSGPLAKYVSVYQFLAALVSILTIIVTLWLSRSKSRRYVKTLASVTLGVLLVEVLAAFGSARGLSPVVTSLGYMCGIQVFFGLTVCLALFTRSDWRWDEPKSPDLASPSVRQVLIFTTGAVFLEPLLGEAFQQKEIGIAPHFVLGIAVTVCSLWVLEMALTKFSHLRSFKISAIFLAELVGLQLFLGIISYSMNLDARFAPGPQPGLVVMNATHAAVGALVLATSLFVTFQAFRYFAPAESKASSILLREHQQAEQKQD